MHDVNFSCLTNTKGWNRRKTHSCSKQLLVGNGTKFNAACNYMSLGFPWSEPGLAFLSSCFQLQKKKRKKKILKTNPAFLPTSWFSHKLVQARHFHQEGQNNLSTHNPFYVFLLFRRAVFFFFVSQKKKNTNQDEPKRENENDNCSKKTWTKKKESLVLENC